MFRRRNPRNPRFIILLYHKLQIASTVIARQTIGILLFTFPILFCNLAPSYLLMSDIFENIQIFFHKFRGTSVSVQFMKSNAGRINLKILSFSPFFCPDQDRSGIESQSLRERSGLSVFLFSYIFLRPFSSHGRRRSSIIFLGNSRLSFFSRSAVTSAKLTHAVYCLIFFSLSPLSPAHARRLLFPP